MTSDKLEAMTTTTTSYPITDQFQTSLTAALDRPEATDLAASLVEYLGEYEHGSVDAIDVHPDATVEIMAAVLRDWVCYYDATLEATR